MRLIELTAECRFLMASGLLPSSVRSNCWISTTKHWLRWVASLVAATSVCRHVCSNGTQCSKPNASINSVQWCSCSRSSSTYSSGSRIWMPRTFRCSSYLRRCNIRLDRATNQWPVYVRPTTHYARDLVRCGSCRNLS